MGLTRTLRVGSDTRMRLIVFEWNDLTCFADLANSPLHPLSSVPVLPEGDRELLVSGTVTYFSMEKTESDRTD